MSMTLTAKQQMGLNDGAKARRARTPRACVCCVLHGTPARRSGVR
jgi:hypothetical protein